MKMLLQFSFFLLALAMSSLPSQAQVWVEWFQLYSGPGNGADAIDMVLDDSANVYVTGQMNGDIATIKYCANGVMQWTAIYAGAGNGSDMGKCIAMDGEGNVLVAGIAHPSEFDDGIVLIKYSAAGQQVWTSFYVDSSGHANVYDMALNVDGDIYLAGCAGGISTEWDIATLKFNSDGNLLWIQLFDGGGEGSEWASAIAIAASGNVCITGDIRNVYNNMDIVTIMYSSQGVQLWVVTEHGAPGEFDDGKDIEIDAGNNVYITGTIRNDISIDNCITVKYDPTGTQLWSAVDTSGSGGTAGLELALDSSGNVFVAGDVGPGTNIDILLIKYDNAGNPLWTSTFAGPSGLLDFPKDIVLDQEGNAYVAGYCNYFVTWPPYWNSLGDWIVLKYSANGDRLWVQYYASGGSDVAQAIALDSQLNILVTGGIEYQFEDCYATVKYTQSGPPNRPPQINYYWPLTLDTLVLNQSVEFSASATDPEGDSLLWQWLLDTTLCGTDTFCVINFDQPGSHRVTCMVSDGLHEDNVIWDVFVQGLGGIDPIGTLSASFYLYPIRPNPFNAAATIQFDLPQTAIVNLDVFDIRGARRSAPHQNSRLPAGSHSITFDGNALPSGLYFCRLTAGDFSVTQKMILMK